ncbi:MAG: SDR family oxidoreductase [Victivallales bacterium]
MNLKDKIALVTGSSRGIGKAIAFDLAKNGCRLIVHGSRDSEALSCSYDDVKKLSPASIKVVANLADSDAISQMFKTVEKQFGRIDVLVNNAATQNQSQFLDLKEEDWDFVMKVNLKAPFLCSQHAGRLMRISGGGKIVNISSVHAYDAKRKFAHYSSSKGGLEILTKSMAIELAEFNIQVNSLVVGAIATEMTPADRCSKLLSAIPAHRIGQADEVARLVTFLSSNDCDYLTGASIKIDGGLTLGFCASRPDL